MLFSQIQGQEQAIHMLRCAMANGHLAHAYLFTGPDGVGKRMTALALAQYLNCQQQDISHQESCGCCPACIQVENGSHPDVILVEPDGASIKIEQIRTLLGQVALRRYQGACKAVILNEAHRMTEQAANCLLKTLEEPKPGTLFVLVTSQPQNLPITILSRCQQIAFQALPVGTVREILQKRHPEKQSQIGLMAALAKGSVQRAENLLANEEFSEARQALYTLLPAISKTGPAQILDWCQKWEKNKNMVRTLLELGQLWYHDVLLVQTAQQWELVLNQDFLAALKTQQPAPRAVLTVLQYIQQGMMQLEANASPRLVLEIVLLKTQAALAA